MKIVFFGNTKYSLIDAQILHNHFGLIAIVTIPDRLGKRNKLTQSPVKTFALQQNIPVIETTKLTIEIIEEIKNFTPDFLVVADFRLILPRTLLNIPAFAPLNIHYSLLPKYRGPTPVPTMLLQGDKKTGVTIIHMNDTVDDGDILAQKEYQLKPDDTTDSVLTILNQLGGQTAVEVIENFEHITPIKQDISHATFTQYMEKQDGYIDLENPPPWEKLDRMIRAYHPWPGVWSKIRIANYELRIKLLPEKKLQVEGKKPQTVKDFLNGYPESKELLEKLHLL